MKANILLWGVAAGLFALDQITKWLVIAEIPANSSIQVIPGLDLVNIRNRERLSVFSTATTWTGNSGFFLAATAVAVGAILILAGARAGSRYDSWPGPRAGGAFGNLLDRAELARRG